MSDIKVFFVNLVIMLLAVLISGFIGYLGGWESLPLTIVASIVIGAGAGLLIDSIN